MEEVFHQPDAEAVWKQIERDPYELSTVVILLAWQEGLGRQEIWELRWDQIDYDAGYLRLKDRNVPLEEKTAQYLQQWRTLLGRDYDIPYVASSLSRKKRVAIQHISKVARIGLDEAGQNEVRLVDLRHDFVRRMREQYDYLDAMRISGESFSTYRSKYIGDRIHGLPTAPTEEQELSEEERLQKLLEENNSGAAGIGLWLNQRGRLKHSDIVRLTWDHVNLENGIIALDEGKIHIEDDLCAVLKAEKESRDPDDDPHVVLTPKSRKPMDEQRLSAVIRTLLVRANLANVRSNVLREKIDRQKAKEQIARLVDEKGGTTRREIEQALAIEKNVLYKSLTELTDEGRLVRTSQGYFSPSLAAPPEQWEELIVKLVEEKGVATIEEVAVILHTGKYSARRKLKSMCMTGVLKQNRGKSGYCLPETQV